MFERFTDAARAAVVGAQTEARALGHGWIGTEHLLLAVVQDPDRPVARQLAGLGLTHDRLHAEVVTTLGGHHDDGSALRDLGIDLDAVRARVEEQFGPGALDPAARTRAAQAAAACCGAAGGRPGRTAAGTSRSAGARRRASSWRCASRWASARARSWSSTSCSA